MANISIKKGSYANKANLKDGDIGFATYNNNTGTLVINDNGTLFNLMPAPGESTDAGKPLISQGQDANGNSISPTYSTLGVKGGGTGRATLTSGYVLVGNGTNAVNLRPITNNTSSSSIKYISASTNLITANTLAYWNGAFSDTGNSRLTKVGTIDKGSWKATPIEIAYGGTGATTAAAARTNLGITPANIGAAALDENGKVLTSQLPIQAAVSYGICETAADVITKEIVIDDNSASFTLQPGAIITIKFSYTNSAAEPKFKIGHKNSDGTITYSEEKSVFYNGSKITTASATLKFAGQGAKQLVYIYDGENFIYIDSSYKTTFNPENGFLYAIASSANLGADGVVAITTGANVASFVYKQHGYVTIKFNFDVPAGTKLNINNTGAKNIYYQGAVITDGIIHSGDTVMLSISRAYYTILSIDRQAYRQLSTFTTNGDLTWYTIAESPIGAKIGSVMGTFEVRAEGEESSSVSTFIAGISNSNYPSITQTSHSQTGVKGIRQVRIVYSSDLEENQAYLQILSGPCEKNVTIKLTEGFGWTLVKTPYADVAEIEEDFSSQQIYLLNNSLVTDYIDTNGIRSDGGIETGAQASSALYGSVIFGQWDPDNDLVEFTCPTLFYDGLDVSGDVSLDAPLSIPNGGTGATTAADARTNLETAYCQIKISPLPGDIGWYRIAQGDGLSNGTFEIKASVSNHHSVTTLIAGSALTGNPSIQQLAHNAYSGTGISKARIVYGGGKAYLEVYQPHKNVPKTITVKITEGFGWMNIDPEPILSIPSNYSSNEIILDTGKIISPTYESYLSWGGKNFASSFGPIDAALAPELGSNRLAYGHPNGITIEYSRDGGATWVDYELHPQNKVRLVTPGLGSAVIVAGKGTAAENGNIAGSQNYQSRVVLSSALLPIYTALNKFIILVGTNGFANCWCTIEKKVGTTWTILADKVGISGWSGYNVINIPNTIVGTGSGQASEIRLTFGGTGQTANSQYTGLGIYSIAAFGGVGWTTPSTLAKVGRIYSLDATTTLDSTGKPIPIVTFPSQVKISDTTAPVNTATGALVVSGGAGIGGDIRVAGNAVVAGKIVAGTNGTAATTNKLTVYGQSQFNGNAAITGTLNVSGATTVKTLTISDTNAIGHLNFSRTGAPNYVVAPDKIAFNIGSSLSLETCALVVASNYVVPGVSKYSTLGTESNLWKGVYAANVRANSFDSKGLQENQIRVWHSESETDALYLFGNQDGRRGLFDMDIGSIISIGPDYVNFNSYRSAGSQWARGREVAPFRSTFVPDRTFNSWSAFFPIFSRKTKLGSWEAGCLMPGTNDYNANNTYNAGSQPSAEHNKLFYEAFHFVHTYDDTYTSNTHTVPLRIFGNGLVHAQKLGVTAAGGYGTGNPPTGTADDPLFVGQLYFKIIE